MNGKVSIVIPCFNQGALLGETLKSVERVRNANLAEVIIVNDGSTDPETIKCLDELADSKYKLIHQPNRGLGPARNTGIRASSGEFVLPLDSDNLIRPPYLKRGVDILLERPDVGVVYGDAEDFGDKTGRRRIPEFSLRQLATENFIDACALYRKSVWESVNGYDERMPWMGLEDWDFWMRVALRSWRFAHLNEIAFDYRVRQGSMLESAKSHSAELDPYIFGKPQNEALRIIREQQREIAELAAGQPSLRASIDYRVGHLLVSPIRKLKRALYGKKS